MSDDEGAVAGIAPEDQARADFYALLSRLFAAPADAPLLAAIAAAAPLAPASASGAPNERLDLSETWDALRAASENADPVAVAEEFVALFVGVGRSEVSLYATQYLQPQSGRPLAELRATLGALGLARRATSSEFEDHLGIVLETMRILVAGHPGRAPSDVADQRSFFDRHVATWAFDCCNAIRDCAIAKYYASVAKFTSSFLALERDSFAIE
jgi:TorA maturation chaperone TorD